MQRRKESYKVLNIVYTKKSLTEESLTKRPKNQYRREIITAASEITLPEAVTQTAGIFVIM